MSNKKQYRFKTKEEFIKEFGTNWAFEIKYAWAIDAGMVNMNHLFGTTFNGILPKKEKRGQLLNEPIWSISMDMLTTKRLPKLLSDGTIAKVGMTVVWRESVMCDIPVIINKVYIPELNEVQITCACALCKSRPSGAYITTVPLKHLRK